MEREREERERSEHETGEGEGGLIDAVADDDDREVERGEERGTGCPYADEEHDTERERNNALGGDRRAGGEEGKKPGRHEVGEYRGINDRERPRVEEDEAETNAEKDRRVQRAEVRSAQCHIPIIDRPRPLESGRDVV